MGSHKIVARAAATQVTRGSGSGPATTRLPTEMLSEQVRRLVVFSTVAVVLWTFALLVEAVILPTLWTGYQRNWRAVIIEVFGTIGSGVMCYYMRRSGSNVEQKNNAGPAMMLIHAIGIAVFNAWAYPPDGTDMIRVSWIALLILIYAIIAPTSPRRMLTASLVAASLDPIAFALVGMFGGRVQDPVYVFVITWPSFACAFIAIVPARVQQQLGRQLHEAQLLGSYHLIERLGTGGMGEVWRAEHRLLARDAAIKLVRPEVLGVKTANEAQVILRRFEREAQATAALSSPHTIQVFDFGITGEGTFYYVMELLAGRDLESLVREFGPLPPNRVMHLLRQICHSLGDAHARGLVHRDIKPANIYVCRMGLDYDFTKVLDFGLVKIKERARDGDSLMTLEQTTTGTPAYMAPEAIVGSGEVDRRADVYALGCVVYFLLTGELVFQADTSMKMLLQHVQAEPTPPSERSELPIPRELDDLVMACLKKDPNQRPADARAIVKMAWNSRGRDEWTQEQAEQWWKAHLPELTGPLAVSTTRMLTGGAVSV
ncbi:MAG TPA: serine/threonine-protein kinase [Vicinamibacterales bacterium]|jgi:serine/threonine-protein kinase